MSTGLDRQQLAERSISEIRINQMMKTLKKSATLLSSEQNNILNRPDDGEYTCEISDDEKRPRSSDGNIFGNHQ
jgi:hypothetical protein